MTKKTKKKYTPRPVHYPQLIIALHSFEPLEKALEELLVEETISEDNNGNYVFIDPTGRVRLFDADLFLYIQYVLIFAQRTEQVLDVTNMIKLRQVMNDKSEFEESVINAALSDIRKYKNLLSKIPSKISRGILETIRNHREQIQTSLNGKRNYDV